MAQSRKKAIVRTLQDELHTGYLAVTGFSNDGQVELLDLGGRIVSIPLRKIRTIAYVRDFNLGEPHPEHLTRTTFLARPRTEGLWVRLTLENGEPFEGLAPLDASLLDGLLGDFGLFLIPPDVRCNTQRVFIPRSAIADFYVVAVVTNPSKSQPARKPKRAETEELPFPLE